jgi:hypothetical protein
MSLLAKLSQARMNDRVVITIGNESEEVSVRDLAASCRFSQRVKTAIPFTNARIKPVGSAVVRAVLPYGTSLTVVEGPDDWYEITTREYAGLWIPRNSFTVSGI